MFSRNADAQFSSGSGRSMSVREGVKYKYIIFIYMCLYNYYICLRFFNLFKKKKKKNVKIKRECKIYRSENLYVIYS